MLFLGRSIFVFLTLLSSFIYVLPLVKGDALALQPYLEYQGRLSDQNGNLLTGNYYVTFCMYATSSPASSCSPVSSPTPGSVSTLGSALWGETEYFSSTNTPDNHVINGVFAARLGSSSAFPSNLFSANSDLYLGVNVYNGSSWDGQMSPLTEVTSAGYSLDSGALVTGTTAYTASTTPTASQIPIVDTSGNLTLPGNINLTNATSESITGTKALSISSGGSSNLTLTSSSGILTLGTGTNKLINTDGGTDLTIAAQGNIDFLILIHILTQTGI